MSAVSDQAAPAALLPPDAEVPGSVADPVSHLAAVYRDYPGLSALILRRVGDPEIAADILQDAAVTALEKLRSGQITRPENMGGYLYRVAINHLRNHRRKDRTAVSGPSGLDELPNTDGDPDWDHVGRHQWAEAARRILDEMPVARDRDLLLRFYLHDEEKSDICRELRLSEEHFNRVIFRARNRFRELLKQHGLWKADFFPILAVLLCLACTVSGIPHPPAPAVAVSSPTFAAAPAAFLTAS
jgi:RNA polymerase sigma-70 factor (ECF subfamily)